MTHVHSGVTQPSAAGGTCPWGHMPLGAHAPIAPALLRHLMCTHLILTFAVVYIHTFLAH